MDFNLLFAVFMLSCVSLMSACYKYEVDHDHFTNLPSGGYYSPGEETNPYDNDDNDDDDGDVHQWHHNYDKHVTTNDEDEFRTQTVRPLHRYEVTEKVDDIPNTSTYRRPTVTAFTVRPLFTNASVIRPTKKPVKPTKDNDEDSRIIAKKTSIDIFHVKTEIDDDKPQPQVNIIQNVRPSFPILNGFRDYFHGVRQGVSNGIGNIFNNHRLPSSNINNGAYVSNFISHPVVFLNNLQRRSADAAAKLHEAILHQFLR